MKHLGDFDAASVLYSKFTTYRPSTGAPFTLAGTPVVSIYKDGSLTQSVTGVTLTVDFDGLTGLHHLAIDTSADGTFFSAGSHFEAVITTGTVDSVSVVGSCVASFSLRKDSALKATVAGRTLDVSAGGEAGLDWANIGSPTTAVNLSATNIDVDQVVASVSGAVGSVTGAVGSVTGNVGGNVTGSIGSVATGGITAGSIAADAIGASELAADAVTEIATGVWAAATRTLSAGTNIVLAKGVGVTGFNDLDAAGVRDAVGLAAANLDTQIGTLATAANLATVAGYVDTEVAAIKAVTDKLDGTLEASSDGQIFTAAALQNAPTSSGGLDAAGVRAAIGLASANLDAQLADLPTNAELSTALGSSDDAVLAVLGTPAGASLAADVAAVQSDTNDIQSRLPAALVSGRIDASVGAMAANVMTAAAAAADLTTELQAGLATASALSTLDGKVDVIDGVVDAILVDTAEIGVAGAGLTALASAASLATVAGYVDTEVAAIKAKTDNLPADPADASDIAAAFGTVNSTLATIAGYVDTEVAAIKAKTDLIPASPAATGDIPSAAAIADAVHDEVVEGTVTLRQSIRLHNAALGGKVQGLDTFNPVFRDLADSKDVIDATVDSYGNRSAVTRDLT